MNTKQTKVMMNLVETLQHQISNSFADFGKAMDKRFEKVDKQFAEAKADSDKQFAELNEKLVETNKRFAEAKADANKRIDEVQAERSKRSKFSDNFFLHIGVLLDVMSGIMTGVGIAFTIFMFILLIKLLW
ncbi:MAG: hypothetical protein HAW61_06445 [Candidatus Portiera sp.]|nr:hypothetical protein [Portiera sp.]